MEYPKIYLALDNCFASKRWTRPSEWIKVIKNLGIHYIEASTDTECDPLYMNPDYLKEWIEEAKIYSENFGSEIVNLYSGHSTYFTLGLSHTDIRVRDRFLNIWLKGLVQMAGELHAGVGFYCHAFNNNMLQNSQEYSRAEEELYDRLSEISEFARYTNTIIGVEQMYTPHQIPWTIDGTKKLLKEVNKRSGYPFYVTVDTGHQTGQAKFQKPDDNEIKEYLQSYNCEDTDLNIIAPWLGADKCYEILKEWKCKEIDTDMVIKKIKHEMDEYTYMFSDKQDCDPYIWLEKLGCYSPIIHLQQTTGKSSSHLPFTADNNRNGIITGEKVLKALAAAYQGDIEQGMPPKCDKIYLTLELFFSTSEISYNIIKELKESVTYWRQFIPEDGLPLDKLTEIFKSENLAI